MKIYNPIKTNKPKVGNALHKTAMLKILTCMHIGFSKEHNVMKFSLTSAWTWELHPGSISRASPEAKNSEHVDPPAPLVDRTTTRLVVRNGASVLLFIGTSVIPGGYSYWTMHFRTGKLSVTIWHELKGKKGWYLGGQCRRSCAVWWQLRIQKSNICILSYAIITWLRFRKQPQCTLLGHPFTWLCHGQRMMVKQFHNQKHSNVKHLTL